ncbi:hypothetical protein pdam_00001467 [Pocillopora damicornis]|uniref:Peptidase aspartic putative domain-containing protein n=1 Tax=Pocillopora damicornis TaxID=46731 RepID=A0A3M6V3Q5_POCDA|nr:hypothetical protein pdam_00001467 [Pocillopora damicornis]
MAAESEDSDVTEFTEKNDKIANGVDKQKENDGKKRSAKTKETKLRHELERLCVKDSEVTDIEIGEDTGENEAFKESENIEKDITKEKKLCSRCLASDHKRKDCPKARTCGIDGCSRNRHRLLHGSEVLSETAPMTMLPHADDGRRPDVPREGAPAANGRKVKINAILDDASNETFLNEAVAGILGLQEPFEKFQVYVINNTVENFQSMPIKIEIETVHGKFSKEISTKTCPQKVTGNYNVVKWNDHQNKWLHLTQCNFPKPANDGLVDLLIGIDNAELHYSHVDLREAVLVRLTRPREHDLTLSVPCPLENLFGAREKNPVRFWVIEKSGTDRDGRLVFTEEERLVLGKVKDFLKYENGRYRVAVLWKENKPDLPDAKPMALSRL